MLLLERQVAESALLDDPLLDNIRTTATKTGLEVRAHLFHRPYEKTKITEAQLRALPITRHSILPKWSYTLSPST